MQLQIQIITFSLFLVLNSNLVAKINYSFYINNFSFVFMRNAVIMSVFLLACSSPSINEMPNKVLSPTEMTSIITDVHLLKGKISVWRKTQAVSQLQEDSLFQLLYEKHNTSEAILDSSLTYYTLQESELLEQIYTEVIEILKKQEADLGN
tara:strand:- start:2691 stop:3143 length:453 start_codon:yes stop_codon:yes gene_type:complete